MNRLRKNASASAVVLLLSAVLIVFFINIIPRNENKNAEYRIGEAEKKLVVFRQEMLAELKRINTLKGEAELNNFFLNVAQNQKGFSYYVFQDSLLSYWSDNEPSISEDQLADVQDGQLLKIPNGVFLSCRIDSGERKCIGLILLRHSYEYENKYLVNNFNPALGLEGFSAADSGYTFHLPENNAGMILKQDPDAVFVTYVWIISLYVFCALCLLMAIYLFAGSSSISFFRTLSLLLIVIGLRSLMIYFKIPGDLYNHDIFSPVHYASSFYFNSLGDMLLNAALLLVFAISLYQYTGPFKLDRQILFVIWVLSALSIHSLINGLVFNSKISFELSSTEEVNRFSFLGFTAIALLLLCLLYITAAFLKRFTTFELTVRNTLLGISIFALYATVSLGILNQKKEQETRKLLAQKVEMRQDHIAEYLFHEQENKISKDTVIQSIINKSKNTAEALNAYLGQKYFGGYMSKFEIKAEVFEGYENGPEPELLNFKLLAGSGKSTTSTKLYYLNSETSGSSYLAIIPLKGNENNRTLVIQMNARFLRSAKGFPELLLSGRQENQPSAEYSIARYSGQGLVYEFGNYIYPLTGKDFSIRNEDYSFLSINNYSHLIHRLSPDTFIVVSRPEGSFFNLLTLFSWMFSFMSVLAFIIFIFSLFFGDQKGWNWNLTRRVQASVIMLVILTLVMVGFGTIYYINTKYQNDQRKSISDQVNALWFMVSDNLNSFADNGNSIIQENSALLNRLASNTNIDFNIYNRDGKLEFTSQPKITDMGIVSDRMNQAAFLNIREKGLTQFIHPENAGRLKYISAYAPVTDRKGNIAAYLNVPYFEKQNELNKEVSIFLSALVNIYVLLFAITVFVTIFISSLITKPLLLLQQKLSGIRLGFTNEKITYAEKDEIGQLVQEYNRMIDELAVSTEKLARSERESAWREMARQVAHEIKNPLTPMKLSVQHLLRAFKDKAHDDALVERITNTLLQQIDTLSNIATAFSSFAKMPQPVHVVLDIKEILQQVADLYNEGVEISLHKENARNVIADKDQLIRIFSNLLKNAVQSIPPDRSGRIDIFFAQDVDRLTVEIRDNGIGIPENQRDKIFTPNFTTKSSGMGLGLAIVRNIVQELNGKIWFTSTYEKGSSFFVSLPVAGE